MSINQFLVQAAAEKAAEKVAALKAQGHRAGRVARATTGDLGRILAKAGTATPIPGDDPPGCWPERLRDFSGA